MGTWGYYQPPLEPPDRSVWEEMAEEAEQESLEEFIEVEMSYADSWEYEQINSDEGGWGAWMGGEL
jgi:hypothetical protein